MNAALSPAKPWPMDQIGIRVLAAIRLDPGIELRHLHAQLQEHYHAPQLRDALDTLHRQGHIYSERTSTGRVQYFPRRGKPLAQAVELARATPEQVVGIGYPQAKLTSAAPGVEASPPAGAGTAPVLPAAPRNVAMDFSGEAPMAVRAGSSACRTYQAMTEITRPITASALAKQLGTNTPAVAVSLSRSRCPCSPRARCWPTAQVPRRPSPAPTAWPTSRVPCASWRPA